MKKLAAVLLVILGLILLMPMFLYWWGLSNLEMSPKPSVLKLTSEQEVSIWNDLNESGSPRIRKTSPYEYLAFLLCSDEECKSNHPGITVSARAIRSQVSEQLGSSNNIVWQFTWAAYTIWITRNWTVHQVLATYHESGDT